MVQYNLKHTDQRYTGRIETDYIMGLLNDLKWLGVSTNGPVILSGGNKATITNVMQSSFTQKKT